VGRPLLRVLSKNQTKASVMLTQAPPPPHVGGLGWSDTGPSSPARWLRAGPICSTIPLTQIQYSFSNRRWLRPPQAFPSNDSCYSAPYPGPAALRPLHCCQITSYEKAVPPNKLPPCSAAKTRRQRQRQAIMQCTVSWMADCLHLFQRLEYTPAPPPSRTIPLGFFFTPLTSSFDASDK
jgi:hypothetical protein